MLAISQLNQYYDQSHTLWDLDLEVQKGECLCIMGRNGVGKTTLLKSIMGLLPIRSGSVKLQAHDLSRLRTEDRVRSGLAYVPQGREVFGQLTVEENLRSGLAAGGKLREAIPDKIFGWFPVLKDMLKRRGGDLSGGQQQQLALGRALITEPKVLLLDEPTEGIQPNIVHMIGDLIERLRQEEGITVLLVEQKLPFARRVGQRFCIMDRGRAVASSAMTDLTDELVSEYLTV